MFLKLHVSDMVETLLPSKVRALALAFDLHFALGLLCVEETTSIWSLDWRLKSDDAKDVEEDEDMLVDDETASPFGSLSSPWVTKLT